MTFKKGQSGNPAGRKVGSKNRFTKIKEQIADAWLNSGAAEVLQNNIVKDLRDMYGNVVKDENGKPIKVIDKVHLSQIIAILPKEPLVVNEGDKHITYVWSGDKRRDESDRDKLRPPALSEGIDRGSDALQSKDNRP